MPDAAMPVNTGVATLSPVVADAGAATAVEDAPIDHGDAGVDETPADESPVDTSTDDAAADDQPADETSTDDAADDGKELSIKAINDKFKELANSEFGKQNAAWLKQLRHDYNSLYTLKQIFPTPADAKGAKDLLGLLGDNPTEALTELQGAQTSLSDLEAAIDASDPDLIAAQFEAHPEGMAGLAPHVLGELYKRNTAAYQRVTTPMIYNAFTHASGPVAVMSQAATLLRSGKAEDVQKALQSLEGFGDVLKNMENYIKSEDSDPLKPEKEKLANERKELNTQAEKNFDSSIDAQIRPIRDRVIDKALEPYTRGKNIDAARLAMIKRNIIQQLGEFADNDKTFISQYNAVRAKKNVENIVKYTGGKLEEVLPGFVDTVAKSFGLTTSAGKPGIRDRQRTTIKGDGKGTSGNRGAAEGTRDNPLRLEPQPKDIDTRRTSTFMRVSQKQAWGKDGKFYSWGS